MTVSNPAYQWIQTPSELADVSAAAPPGTPVFLDTEFMRERTFWPVLALLQLRVGDAIFLVDPLGEGMAGGLLPLIGDRVLYMHGCSEDLEALLHSTGALPDRVGDTQIAAALTGLPLQCGYQRLVEEVLGVQLPKGATRSDWLQRPLSAEQLEYAVHDVVYLPALVETLLERLEQRGRVAWWEEECARLVREAGREAEPQQAWRQIKGAGRLPPGSLAAAQTLAAWREEQARARDLPRGFVLRDADLLEVAQQAPANRDQLGRMGLHPKVVRRHGEQLLGLLESSRHLPAPEPLPGPPQPEERALIKRLRARVGEIASQMGLEPEVLMRRRWLEALVRHPEAPPEPLCGWRMETVTRPLLELIR